MLPRPDKPKLGDVWKRDGRRRTVTEVEHIGSQTYYVRWDHRTKWSWCAMWEWWAAKATLIERDGQAVV